MTNDGNGNTPTYDAENRITTDAGVTYSYDADGFRMEKSPGTMYWPGPSGTLTETDLTGAINEEYIYFNGARLARVDRPNGAVHYYFSDKLGSASVITDASGNVTKQDFYFPYGRELTSSTGTDPNHYKFNGKERDAESNLDEFGARYYTSAMGRFMTPDWAANATAVPYANFGNPQSLNLYSYVENNPTTTGDPDGHCPGDATHQAGTGCTPVPVNYPDEVKVETGVDTTPPTKIQTLPPNIIPPIIVNVNAMIEGPPRWWRQLKLTAFLMAAESARESKLVADVVSAALTGVGNLGCGCSEEKPKRTSNPKRHPNSASPEPKNVQELFDKSIKDTSGSGARWAQDADGTIHRFSPESNGETHWNGSTAGDKPIRMNDIPPEIKQAFGVSR